MNLESRFGGRVSRSLLEKVELLGGRKEEKSFLGRVNGKWESFDVREFGVIKMLEYVYYGWNLEWEEESDRWFGVRFEE